LANTQNGVYQTDLYKGNDMTLLKCLQEHRHDKKLKPRVNLDKRSLILKEEDLIGLFPLPRYFQIHFEHIHDNAHELQGKLNHLNHDLQNQLDLIKESLVKVESTLDRFIALLDHHIETQD